MTNSITLRQSASLLQTELLTAITAVQELKVVCQPEIYAECSPVYRTALNKITKLYTDATTGKGMGPNDPGHKTVMDIAVNAKEEIEFISTTMQKLHAKKVNRWHAIILGVFLFGMSLMYSFGVSAETYAYVSDADTYSVNTPFELTEEFKMQSHFTEYGKKREEEKKFSILFGGISKHLSGATWNGDDGVERELTEVNPGIGIEYNNWAIIVTTLSYDNTGVAVYYTAKAWESQYLDVGFRVGGVWGYDKVEHADFWVIVPLVAMVFEIKPIEAISIEPAIMSGGAEEIVVTLNAKYNF